MSGFCGWFGETGDSASRADALGAMAARLPDYGKCGDGRVHGDRGGLIHRGRQGEFSWHAEDGIWVAIEGHPRWTDAGLRHTAAQNGHGAAVASAFSERRSSAKSKSARLKPNPRIGLISGEISIAPMTTAGDDRSKPRTAIPADIIVMKA